jgi:hypothetical protein
VILAYKENKENKEKPVHKVSRDYKVILEKEG